MRKPLSLILWAALLASAAPAQNKKIVVTGRFADWAAELQKAAPGVTVEAAADQEILQKVADADAIFGTIDPQIVKAGKKLKWVQIYSAGVENFVRHPEVVNSDIVMTNCKIIQGPNIADHAMALLLALTRGVYQAIPLRSREEWLRGKYPFTTIELTDKTALIIGLGGIGTQIAQRARAFGMRVTAVDPKDIPITSTVEKIVTPDRLHEVLPQADVVFMSAPHTRQTEGMMGAAEFGMMKKGSYFIAVSRGRTYDSNALVKALDEKRLAGAGLDVTNPEPLPKGHPLWKFENVIITPHIAGGSDLVNDRRLALFKENIRRFAAGKPLLNVVDKQKGY
jgi:phosphoglycerate dehydrogenase-like enzyme